MRDLYGALSDLEYANRCRIYCHRFIYEDKIIRIRDGMVSMMNVTILLEDKLHATHEMYNHKEITILMDSIESFCRLEDDDRK